MIKQGLFGFIFSILLIGNSQAQVEKNSELYKTILSKDSLLFDIGFNTCNIAQFENLLSEGFEFLHDIDGISDKTRFLTQLKKGLCGNPANYQSRRELLPESTKIYALYNKGTLYGAIQEGIHQFYENETGKAEKFASSALFTHVWLLEKGDWKLARSLSYEHLQKQLTQIEKPIFDNDAAIEQWLKENKVPTLGLGIIEAGKLTQVKVFGENKKGSAAPYNTIFNVASLTKPITAMVALKLVSMGKWSLDEPVYKYWTDEDIANDPRHKKLTTRLILSHQTGFPNWRYSHPDNKLTFLYDPGTRYQYSGEGFEYLRKALEKKFKKSLQQLAAELIFTPLGMDDTRYIWDGKIDTTRLALGYNKTGEAYKIVKNETPNAADDLYTTIEDYALFLISVMSKEGLSEPLFQEMISHQVASSKGKHFGLGLERYDFPDGEYALCHGGSDQGVQTVVFIFPKSQKGLLIFTNVDDGHKVFEKLLVQYLGTHGQQIFDIETK